ncbi:MAG TPA: hypothetical protein VMN60_01695 [Longimicrobiales bacterium]|nr:hypothetical protein [Longimicrobiales bacterium]
MNAMSEDTHNAGFHRARLRWRLLASALVALAFVVVADPAAAQLPPAVESLFELRTADGNKFIGRVISETEGLIVFESITGTRLELNRAFVRLRPARGRLVDGEFWEADRHTSRLFFAPTGRTLAAGEGYIGLFLILPFIGYGATDNLTLAGGIPPAGDFASSPVWLAPKFRVLNQPERQVSAGLFAIHLPRTGCADFEVDCEDEEGGWVGITYGIATFGSDDAAIHAGGGVTFATGDVDAGKIPLMVGGERRVGRRTKLLTENWLIPGEGGAASVGLRRIGERWTWDFGWMFLFGGESGDDVPYFPVISFSYGFGGR